MESGDWLTAAEILQLLGAHSCSDGFEPTTWKSQGDIFTIVYNGTEYYPMFGLEKEAGYRPYSVMSKIIYIFKDDKDGWGMAFWFQSVNSYLGGKRPQDIIATAPDPIIDAALDEVRCVTHG
ncbi:conserved hypothetical protein [Halomonas sp. A3H3]|uniref:hypothetical protein n=1 Tax=Halomonas sp. A3H3 TaxID=1346287 RepID=UPI00038D9A7D|nr:hypothetical protein [Halomonas sp. A3H3]CDG52303.1 conserved hypothetical protein [Halomonas sp. A3H3]